MPLRVRSAANVDYGQIIKTYGTEQSVEAQRRYSAPKITESEKKAIFGDPDLDLVSTSYVERLNATTRLHMKRLAVLRTPSVRSGKTLRRRSGCTSLITISCAATTRCVARPRWRLALSSHSGVLATCLRLQHERNVEELRDVIRHLHGVESKHVGSVPIKETFRGNTVWEGVVEVFELIGHPTANELYAWSHATDDPDNPKRHVTVLHMSIRNIASPRRESGHYSGVQSQCHSRSLKRSDAPSSRRAKPRAASCRSASMPAISSG